MILQACKCLAQTSWVPSGQCCICYNWLHTFQKGSSWVLSQFQWNKSLVLLADSNEILQVFTSLQLTTNCFFCVVTVFPLHFCRSMFQVWGWWYFIFVNVSNSNEKTCLSKSISQHLPTLLACLLLSAKTCTFFLKTRIYTKMGHIL